MGDPEAFGPRDSGRIRPRAGITPARLGSICNGAELSKEVAFRLRKRVPGLTLDWIWFGYWDGIPVELAQNLRQLLDQPMSDS